MGVLANAFERRTMPSAAPVDPTALSIPSPGSAGLLASSGARVTDKTALSVMAFFAGVRLISDSVAFTPLRAVRWSPDGTKVPVSPSPQQITDPFAGVNLQEGQTQIVTSLILRGNAYCYEVDYHPSTLKPTSWMILNPDAVRVDWDPDNYGARRYRVGSTTLDPDKMSHVSMFMLPQAATGVGILEYCRNAIGLGISLDEAAGEFFANGVMSTGVIGVNAALTEDDVRSVADQFVQNHSGKGKRNLPIVMGGGATYTPLSLTPEDAQFIQSRQFQEGQIATLLGIPPHLLGMVDRTTSWGTGIEVQGRAFVDYTLRTYFERLKTMFTGWIPKGQYADYDTDALTRADTGTRYDNYTKALNAGWQNVDEVRLRENLPKLPNGGGETYRVLANTIPAANADGAISASPAAALPSENPKTGD